MVMQKCDVYAFGVVLLELLSEQESLRYVVDEESGGYSRQSVIDSAKKAVAYGVGGVRKWVDKRLKDLYLLEVAEKMVELALECVEEDLAKRLDMGLVAGRISKLYLESKTWAEKIVSEGDEDEDGEDDEDDASEDDAEKEENEEIKISDNLIITHIKKVQHCINKCDIKFWISGSMRNPGG
ncbi:hypothetical protein SLEP1_g9796 [Rubroshorea leprosula]|uniref:Protein kinase domain-containing protein n=1 Tax=Rubroshorea leprosula TaxID=152421 RepID=A0AAV5IFE5_9ROSI|nr:hypothetical protein SLEP1_g9796 [Rubroshorea leprosula]